MGVMGNSGGCQLNEELGRLVPGSHSAKSNAMPRDGAIIFSDLIGKLDLIRVACDKCGRDGCYGSNRLIERRGRDAG